MSHTGVDVLDFLLFTLYPVAALFIIEMFSRFVKIQKWIKLCIQGIVSSIFAIAYFTFPGDHKFPLTAAVLLALAIALFYQSRRAKISPDKSIY